MEESLQNGTATPNIPVSSVTTTAPFIWQVTHSVDAPRPGLPFVQDKEASQLPACPCAQVSFQLCRGKWCVLCYRQDLGSLCTPRLEMHQWLQVASVVDTDHSQRALLKKNPTVDALMTAGQSAGIYFCNITSCISITTCVTFAWTTWAPHFSTYATELGLSTD